MDDDSVGFLQKLKFSTGEVTSCDVNANYLLALGLSDNTIRILEWKTGLGFVDVFYSPLDFHKYKITSVRFSPKGTMLASSSLDGTAILIDVLKGTKIFTMVQHHKSNVKFCEFTFDSTKAITAADDGILCFWDLLHQRQIRHFRFLEDDCNLRSLSLSPDSDFLLSIDSTDLLKLWFVGDIANNQPRCILHKRDVHNDNHCCQFSPVKGVTGGGFLRAKYVIVTCGGDDSIRIWDLTIDRERKSVDFENFKCSLILSKLLKQHASDIINVRFDPSGNYLVSTGLDNLINLWETRTGKRVKTFRGHTGLVTCFAFSKDSVLLASGSTDDVLIVWDITQNLTLDSQVTTSCNVSSHFTDINLTSYFIESNEEYQIRELDFTLLQTLRLKSFVNAVQFQDNILAIAGGEKTVTIWKMREETFEITGTLQKYKYSINDLDISPCGTKIIFCSLDGVLIYWDLNMDLTHEMRTPCCTASLRTCRFLPDSKYIAAAGDDQEVYLWDANNLEFAKILEKHENAVTALAFTPDGKHLVSVSDGGHIVLKNLEEGKDCRVNNAHDLGVTSCNFSSAEITEQECAELHFATSKGKFEGIYLLATGGKDSLVKLWAVERSEISILTVFSGHGGTVNFVTFSPCEPFMLASCSNDTTVRIWHAKTKQCLHVLNSHKSAVTTCSFSKDSALLATGSLDKTVLIFKLTEKFSWESREWMSVSNNIKLLENWTKSDLADWLLEMGLREASNKVKDLEVDGRTLLTTENDAIIDLFKLSNQEEKSVLKQQVFCLKRGALSPSGVRCKEKVTTHTFLCPITHEIMMDPVICSDGFAYDRAALLEWFLSRKFISPVTKEHLKSTKLLSYPALKNNIYKYLYENYSHS